jgi:hypothetical protein
MKQRNREQMDGICSTSTEHMSNVTTTAVNFFVTKIRKALFEIENSAEYFV